MEYDQETETYNTLFRVYDPLTGRWWSTDPITHPWQSPYTAFDNNPVWLTDPLGLAADKDRRVHRAQQRHAKSKDRGTRYHTKYDATGKRIPQPNPAKKDSYSVRLKVYDSGKIKLGDPFTDNTQRPFMNSSGQYKGHIPYRYEISRKLGYATRYPSGREKQDAKLPINPYFHTETDEGKDGTTIIAYVALMGKDLEEAITLHEKVEGKVLSVTPTSVQIEGHVTLKVTTFVGGNTYLGKKIAPRKRYMVNGQVFNSKESLEAYLKEWQDRVVE